MSTPSYYTWGTDWMPVAPLLNGQVIADLNNAITAGLRALPGRGQEVGGILLGTVEFRAQSRPVVRIEGFDPLECEHRRGPSFVLSEKDKKTLGKRLHWWSRQRKSSLRPVGFFRSHTRRGLYLDNDDYAVIRSYFPEPQSVFLLVRPNTGAVSVGGFFFWEDGDIHRESSNLEFPFDVSRLPLREYRPTPVAPSVPYTATASPAPVQDLSLRPRISPAAATRPTAAASQSEAGLEAVIPGAGSGEPHAGTSSGTLLRAEASQSPPTQSVPARISVVSPQPTFTGTVEQPAATPPPGAPLPPRIVTRPAARSAFTIPNGRQSSAAAPSPTASKVPAAAAGALPPPASRWSGHDWTRVAILPAALLLFSLTFYAARHRAGQGTNPASPVAAVPATSARETGATNQPPILDKPSPMAPKEVIEVNPPAVTSAPKTGSSPERSGSAARASVREEASVTSPRSVPVTPAPASSPAPSAPPPAESAPAPLVATAVPPPAAIVQPLRTEHPQPPPSLATVTVEPVSQSKLGRLVGHIPGLRRLGKKKQQGFVPARAIREVAPRVPSDEELAKNTSVDLRVTVDPSGKVANVEPARGGDKRLVQLASDAARSWQFEPARVDEETVSSELILHFTFRPPTENWPAH